MTTQETTEIISEGLDYDLGEIIERYADEQNLPTATALAHFGELKKYLILCAVFPEKRYPMTMPIDEAWHTFLIYTEDYAKFCDVIAGRFIHHHPEKRTQEISEEYIQNKRSRFLDFQNDYKLIFGYEAEVEYWPRLKNITDSSTCHAENCSRCHGNECD